MGNILQSLSKKEIRLVMVGLDNSGKTTVLHKLKHNTNVSTIPTIGFNVDTFKFKNLNLNVWDIGGQDKIVSSRMRQASKRLHDCLDDDLLKNVLLMILANKQDVPTALNVDDMKSRLDLDNIKQWWICQPTCALTGQGLVEAFTLLSKKIKKDKKKTS